MEKYEAIRKFKEAAKLTVVKRFLEKREVIECINFSVDPEILAVKLGRQSVDAVQNTIILGTRDEKNWYGELGIFTFEEFCIVTVSEYRRVKARFSHESQSSNYDNLQKLYVAGNIRCLYFEGNDPVVQFLRANMMPNLGGVNDNFQSGGMLARMLLFNNNLSVDSNFVICLQEEKLLAKLIDKVKEQEINQAFLSWNPQIIYQIHTEKHAGYYKAINFTVDLDKEGLSTFGSIIEGKGMLALTLNKSYDKQDFAGTSLDIFLRNYNKMNLLREGTQIFLVNEDSHLCFELESMERGRIQNIETSFTITNRIKIVIFQPATRTQEAEFFDDQYCISDYQLYESFKVAVREHLRDDEYLMDKDCE